MNHPSASSSVRGAASPPRDALAEGYNDIPYTSLPDRVRHPDRLATIGALLGLDVARVTTSRVLEFGCGDGSNLVPIAATLPNAEFVGFDFAARPVARARRMADELGLTNIRLLELDLRELPQDLGTFDYIIAHGFYSWVPGEVRTHVMPSIARHLARNGVAFVSYNTLPGCHMRRIVWDMARYHTRDIPDKASRLVSARSFLDLVATPVSDDLPTQKAIRAEVRNAAAGSDAALAHDDLSELNNPFYFHEFTADATRAGLTFLSEAWLGTMTDGGLAPEVRQALGQLDRLAREQYLDFIRFRHFRESLLCHAGATSNFVVQPQRARKMHVLPSLNLRRAAASSAPVAEADPGFDAVKQFLLARWPQAVPVEEMERWRAQDGSDAAPGAAARSVAELVVELYVAGQVDLHTAPVGLAAVPGDRPEVFAPARWLSREREVIPSLYHEALRFHDPLGRRLLALLDGTRNREELAAALDGPFALSGGRARLDSVLKILASKALLVR
jgi:SAM-dependent methyltransferase